MCFVYEYVYVYAYVYVCTFRWRVCMVYMVYMVYVHAINTFISQSFPSITSIAVSNMFVCK